MPSSYLEKSTLSLKRSVTLSFSFLKNRYVCSAILAKCLIINVLRLILVILFFYCISKYYLHGTHTWRVIEELQKLPGYLALTEQDKEILWTAALLHDVEKRSTTVIEEDGSITAKGHARKGEYTVRTFLYKDVSTPFIIREKIASFVRFHGLPL